MSDFEEEHPDFTSPDEMSSMTLVMEGQKLYVHKEVLAAWSPVFKSMFTRDFRGLFIVWIIHITFYVFYANHALR